MVAPVGACMVPLAGHAWFLWGGMHGCSGACVVAPGGGHAWLLWGGACVVAPGGMRDCSGGACVVAPAGVCMVLFRGACVVFSVFSDTMRYGQ